ncbi:MAG: M3 family metallopeptidase [Pseudomonadota bacterium]
MNRPKPPLSTAFKDLPDFENISADQIEPITDALLERSQAAVERLTTGMQYTFDGMVVAHEELRHDLARTWSPISHLNMVCNSEAWQQAYLEALARITAFSSELGQNAEIYKAFAEIHTALPEHADTAERQVLEHALRDFRLAGIALDDAGQERFRELMQTLSAKQAQFANHVQRCADEWQWHTESGSAVAGLPQPVLRQARQAAEIAGKPGWLFGLTQPVYQAVIMHASDRDTRARFYRAWMTRASDQGDHSDAYDNTGLISDILAARSELAQLLDFDTYADYSLAAKMAGSVDEVVGFLTDLCGRSKATAERELKELRMLAGHDLEAWDLAYYTEQLKERAFAISDEAVRPYFPVSRVIEGLFGLAGRLFGISLRQVSAVSVWHDDVQFIEVSDADGSLIGGFFTDLFARAGKRSGAWIDECVVRKALAGSTSLPVGYLVCNFNPAEADTPSLLTHNDVVTLFHEFGHMLHHLLTRVDYPSIAGINGVPWDAVELPSQFMENFAWQYDVLRDCTAHHETGESLPQALFDKLYASRNVGAGLQMLRQLEFALFDFRLHARIDSANPGVIDEVLQETRDMATLIRPPAWNRFANGFAHIFAGGYAAGYYSYKWAEVLAADAFSAFADANDIFDPTVAKRFREHILEIGGSRNIHHAFVEFRGREPSINALLVNSGIIAA